MTDLAPVLGRFDRPTSDRSTRIAVLSDLHLTRSEEGTWRVSHRTEDRLEATVSSLNDEGVDAVFFNGDLVQSGTMAQFEAVDRILSDLEPPFFAVPGNHDLIDREDAAVEPFTLPEFEERYTPGGVPFRHRVGGVDLIGLNSNSSTRESVTKTYEGRLSADALDWLDEVLTDADCPLVVVHHTLDSAREHYLHGREQLPIDIGGSPGFANASALSDLLAEHEVPLVLTGHLHFPAVARFDTVRELTLPSLGPFPCGYTVLEIDEEGTTATFQSVAEIDRVIEALGYGLDSDRVLLAAARMARLPMVDDHA